MLLINHVTT